MFVGRLSAQEQAAFLTLAERLLAADGQPGEAEQATLAALRAEAAALRPGWRPDPGEDATLEDLLAPFRAPTSRGAVLVELLGLALVDLEYHPEERRFIEEVAERLGVGRARLALMEGWVIRQLALAAEGERLLDVGGPT